MALPFTREQFLGVFESYNTSVWPVQIALYILAGAAIYMALSKSKIRNKAVLGILSFLWFWIGIVYHIMFFTKINPAAYLFGALFILQGILFMASAIKDKISFDLKKDMYGFTGAFFILYALAIYPALNYLFGHGWPNNPTFGLPCPTAIFTFGLLLFTTKKVPKYILIIPFLWSLLGISASVSLGIWEDTMLVVSGILTTSLLWMRDKRR